MSNAWKLIFVIPNLEIKNPIECEKLALVPSDDKRLDVIKQECFASKALLINFSNQFGKNIQPSAILLNDEAPPFCKQLGKIVDFRNAIAICGVIEGSIRYINRGRSSEPMFSDFFDLYPITPSSDSKYLITHTPILLGLDEPNKFSGQVSPLIIYTDFKIAVLDEHILNLLLRLWKNDPEKKTWKARAIFRSLQIAYQASTIAYDNASSEIDFGSRIGLWISAFETLIHSGRKREVGVREVLELLNQKSFSKPELRKRRYRYRKKSVNFIQKIYSELYNSRNTFFHGNPIKDKHRYLFANKTNKSFLVLAPLLYKLALRMQLSGMGIEKKGRGIEHAIEIISEENKFEDALIKCLITRIPNNSEDTTLDSH